MNGKKADYATQLCITSGGFTQVNGEAHPSNIMSDQTVQTIAINLTGEIQGG